MIFRFIHTADWHADSDEAKQGKLEASLSQIVEYCKSTKINAIVISGDIWEKKQSYSERSGVPLVIYYLSKLSKLVDFIFITKGNNSHDEPGSISLLHKIEPNIYAYEYPVCLAVDSDGEEFAVIDLLKHGLPANQFENLQYIVSLVPYPTKSMFISDQSIDNNNAEFIEKFEQIFELIGDTTASFDCPKILGFHGNVVGSRLSSGQSLLTQDIMVAPSTLEKAKHHYYAVGHIHLRQLIKWNIVYSGSTYNKTHGETEQKSFEVVEFDTASEPELVPVINTTQVYLTSTRPMIKVESEYNADQDVIVASETIDLSLNPEVRFKLKVKENDRNLITEGFINNIKSYYGADTRIEITIIPNERESRSEEIMTCKSLFEEVQEYAKVIEFSVNGTIQQKVNQLQEMN